MLLLLACSNQLLRGEKSIVKVAWAESHLFASNSKFSW